MEKDKFDFIEFISGCINVFAWSAICVIIVSVAVIFAKLAYILLFAKACSPLQEDSLIINISVTKIDFQGDYTPLRRVETTSVPAS